MKVLYFSKGLTAPISGPQSVGKNLAEYLSSITDDIEFFFITDKIRSNYKGELIQNYLNNSFPLPEVPFLSFEWENFLSSRAIRNICRMFEPDLVHIHGYAGYYPSPPQNCQTLVTFHDFPPMMMYDDYSVGLLKIPYNLWFARGRMIRLKKISQYNYYHVLSSEIAKFLVTSGISPSRIFFILNGVPDQLTNISVNKDYARKWIRKKLSLHSSDKILTMVGTISYRKGIHFIKRVLDDLPSNFHLVLVGKPPRIVGNQYLKKILSGKSSSRIHFIGYQPPDVVRIIIRGSDCFLSLSLSEACQLSPLEALAYEVPVIITNCGAAVDVFGSHYELLVSISPDARLLRNKIISAVENYSKYINIETNTITWKKVAKQLKEAYFSIYANE